MNSKVNKLLEKKLDEDTPECDRLKKKNMNVLMKQMDKQKNRLIGMDQNSTKQGSDRKKKLNPNPKRRMVSNGTQTTEQMYGEEQVILIYGKLNESKEKIREHIENEKKLKNEKEELINEIEDLKVCKTNLETDTADKDTKISELNMYQEKYLDLVKKMKDKDKDLDLLKQNQVISSKNAEKFKKKLAEFQDLNKTMHETLLVQTSNEDVACKLHLFIWIYTAILYKDKEDKQ